MKLIDNLVCPLDDLPLYAREQQLVCDKGHAFDIARQGYVNLLPVQHKRSRQPGDSREMVFARRDFLDGGYYEAIAGAVCEILSAHVTASACLADFGCGNGYYLDYVARQLQAADTGMSLLGFDISKYAVQEAARRNRQITWLVASNRQPPIAHSSVDAAVCMFGFHSFDAFYKVLKPGGVLLLVDAGPDHLQELRALLYDNVKRSVLPAVRHESLVLRSQATLTYCCRVSQQHHIKNLLQMTPHFFRARADARERVLSVKRLALTVDVVFRVLRKPL